MEDSAAEFPEMSQNVTNKSGTNAQLKVSLMTVCIMRQESAMSKPHSRIYRDNPGNIEGSLDDNNMI